MRIVEDVILRRDRGEFVMDSDVIDSHAELMPELADRLRALKLVQRAEQTAHFSSTAGEGHTSKRRRTSNRAGSSAGTGGGFVAVDDLPTHSIPGYEIISEIHRGGQGVVYRARQHATRRDVAIKVMRAGPFGSSHDRERFEREVRILGQLRHPNIVTIHDSGTVQGHHFFVMDHINGHPIDVHLIGRVRTSERILPLFLKICDAVHAAHLRGVIHRDLKPGNVLIDDHGEPHVLDFGLAKITSNELGETSQGRQMTMTGQFIGSVPWASPEQADGPTDGVDLRADVYALGALLYFMLTGRCPYDITGSMLDVLDRIRRDRPVRPSSIRPEIDGDVEPITLKCLEKEPDRRYQSVSALAEDVRRYLSSQPILARAPSTIYQLRKLVTRHKLSFAFVTTLFILLAGFAVAMSALYAQAAAQRNRAAFAEKRAEERRIEARQEADTAQAINDFLINDMLASASPALAQGRDLTVDEVLANASKRIERAFEDQPLVEASVRMSIGQTYLSLGLFPEAIAHISIAEQLRAQHHGDDHPDTLRARLLLGTALQSAGELSAAGALLASVWDQCHRVLGDDHPDTMEAAFQNAVLYYYLGNLKDARALHREILSRRRSVLGDSDPGTLSSIVAWGKVMEWRDEEPGAAEQLLREAFAGCRNLYGESHPQTLLSMMNLGAVLADQRRFEEAEPLLVTSYEQQRHILGTQHPDMLLAQYRLGMLRKEQNRLREAVPLLRGAFQSGQESLGLNHPVTLIISRQLGYALIRGERDAEAAKFFQSVLEAHTRVYGEMSAQRAEALQGIGLALSRLGRWDEAEPLHRQAVQSYDFVFGDERQQFVGPLRFLMKTLAVNGKPEEARPIAATLLELRKQGADHEGADPYRLNCYARALLEAEPPDLRDPALALAVAERAFEKCTDSYHYNRFTLARAYHANGLVEEAIAMVRRALEHAPVEGSYERTQYEDLLVQCLEQSGRPGEAEDVYRDLVSARRAAHPENAPDIADALDKLGTILLAHGQYVEAEAQFRDCLSVRHAAPDEQPWKIPRTWSMLGEVLFRQGRFEEAEPLLKDALGMLESDEWAPRFELQRTVERLDELYAAWDATDASATNPDRSERQP